MDTTVKEKYLKAGEISYEAKKYAKTLVKEDARLYDVAEAVESFILQKGGSLAFPINLSINEEAAHYTPSFNDTKVFRRSDLVKVDLGVHIDGYIADTAFTVEVSTFLYQTLIKSSRYALKNAISKVRPKGDIRDVGNAVETTIKEFGLRPVSNLTGHQLDRYLLHGNKSVWNVKNNNIGIFDVGEAFAIEPFSTNGDGYVENGGNGNIYRFTKKIDSSYKELYQIYMMYKDLPFAMRWIERDFSPEICKKIRPYIKHYPILLEKKDALVSQFEETVIIEKSGVTVTTNRESEM